MFDPIGNAKIDVVCTGKKLSAILRLFEYNVYSFGAYTIAEKGLVLYDCHVKVHKEIPALISPMNSDQVAQFALCWLNNISEDEFNSRSIKAGYSSYDGGDTDNVRACHVFTDCWGQVGDVPEWNNSICCISPAWGWVGK